MVSSMKHENPTKPKIQGIKKSYILKEMKPQGNPQFIAIEMKLLQGEWQYIVINWMWNYEKSCGDQPMRKPV